MSDETSQVAIWRRSLTLRTFGVISAIELLVASAYVSQLLGWVMLLVACVLLGASVGSFPSDSVGGLRQHRQ
jgi:predicted permease